MEKLLRNEQDDVNILGWGQVVFLNGQWGEHWTETH